MSAASRNTEVRLPAEILALGSLDRSEWAWRLSDVQTAIAAAREHNLATLGGQVQFRCPGGTYELYWLNADSSPRHDHESWPDFVSRTAEEVVRGFRTIFQPGVIEEGVRGWPALEAEGASGVDLNSHLWFVLYFVTEAEHATLESPRDVRQPPPQ